VKTFKSFITESYNNWENEEPVEYSKHLEKMGSKE